MEISGDHTYVLALSGEGKTSAIGHGENDSDYGTIDLAANMSVKGAWSKEECESSEPFPWDTRELACQYRWCAIVQSCEHPVPVVGNLSVVPCDSITEMTHRRSACKYCCTTFVTEPHDLIDGVCSVCGFSENGFRLSFDGNGAEGGMESFFIAQGRSTLLPDCLFTPPENTKFIGWKIGEETYPAGEPVTVDRDMTAVAQWSAPLIVTLVPGEGSGEPISVETSLGEKYPLPVYTDCNFTEPEWYLFEGWAVNGDETDLKQPLDPVTIETDTRVTAIWERPQFTVTFDSNGGSKVDGQRPLRGAHVFRPDADPTREGFTFKDWYLDNEPFDFENTPITEDITLTAVWLNPWETLQARIDAAADGETIALGSDVTAEADDVVLTIPAGKAITLDLAGHTLSRGMIEAVEDGNAITVNGSLTVNDSGTGGAITGGFNHGSGGGVLVANGGALTLNGGAITGNRADGSNAVPANGGGVYIRNGGSFTMNGGTITNNTTQQNVADCHGGGVYVAGSFTLNGGTVGHNTALTNGGGVYVADGTFAMTGGAITDGNWGYQGGGVYIAGGTFAMTGGAITGNKATRNGGGVNCSGGTFTLSGAPVITGNTGRWDAANNLYLAEGLAVTIDGTLTGEQPVGLTMETPGPFTSGLSGNGTAASFRSDDAAYAVGVNDGGEAFLGEGITVTFDSDGGTVVPAQGVFSGEKVDVPKVPVKAGYAFLGWQLNGAYYDFDTPVTEAITLVADWEIALGTPDFTLPADITLIEEHAFEGIDAQIVYIPDGCTEIEPYAFKDCKNLIRVRIPSGCAIGEFAFEGCENLYIFSVSGDGAEQYCAHHDNCTFVAEQ